jgi:aryl-alcohol dehydrogenase-like predicted oxidoreductase
MYYSLVGRGLEHEFQSFAEYHNIGILVWSPLAGGFLAGKYAGSDAGELPARDALGELDRADGGLAVAGIVSRVESHLLTLAQASDAGALQRGGVDEHVLLAIIRQDKAEASLVIVELNGARIHGEIPFH